MTFLDVRSLLFDFERWWWRGPALEERLTYSHEQFVVHVLLPLAFYEVAL